MIVLVTGATGFVGGHLLKCAKERFSGTDVEFVILSSRPIEGFRCVLHKVYTFSADDFAKAGIDSVDAVIHLGAFAGQVPEVRYSASMNLTTVKNTEYLLGHLPNTPKVFIHCSSIDVYGRAPGQEVFDKEVVETIDETRFPTPMNNYAMAKLFSEEIVLEWARKNNVLTHILRLGNQYGPGDKRRYFINVIIENAVAGKPLVLTAHPDMIRNYIFVDDTCNFILNSLSVREDVGPINLVSAYNPTMLEIVQTVSRLSSGRIDVIPMPRYFGKNMVYDSKKREALFRSRKVLSGRRTA